MVPVSFWCFLDCIRGGIGRLDIYRRYGWMLPVCCGYFVIRKGGGVGLDPVVMVSLTGVTTDAWYISYIAVLGWRSRCSDSLQAGWSGD